MAMANVIRLQKSQVRSSAEMLARAFYDDPLFLYFFPDPSQRIKKSIPSLKIVASESDGAKLNIGVDVIISDGDQLKLGKVNLKFILTPGHTPGGICIIVDNEALLTGDTLFIGDCGRTDLPGGDLTQMYNSLNEKIKSLPDNLIVYPGHDYGDKPFDTLGNQKRTNKTLLAKNLNDFSKIP